MHINLVTVRRRTHYLFICCTNGVMLLASHSLLSANGLQLIFLSGANFCHIFILMQFYFVQLAFQFKGGKYLLIFLMPPFTTRVTKLLKSRLCFLLPFINKEIGVYLKWTAISEMNNPIFMLTSFFFFRGSKAG